MCVLFLFVVVCFDLEAPFEMFLNICMWFSL